MSGSRDSEGTPVVVIETGADAELGVVTSGDQVVLEMWPEGGLVPAIRSLMTPAQAMNLSLVLQRQAQEAMRVHLSSPYPHRQRCAGCITLDRCVGCSGPLGPRPCRDGCCPNCCASRCAPHAVLS